MLQQCGPRIQQQILQNLKLYSAGQPAGLPVTTSAPLVRCKDLNWRTLEQLRIDSRLTLMYKFAYDLVAISAADLIPNTRQSRHNHQSKKISNDQELIQSDPTSCPQNQKGNN